MGTTLSKEARRAGLEYAKKLDDLAASAPDPVSKSCTYRAVATIRKVLGWSEEEKKSLLIYWLKKNCTSYDQLVAETDIPKPEVVRLVNVIKSDGKVMITKTMSPTGGRPSDFIVLIEPTSDFITPKN